MFFLLCLEVERGSAVRMRTEEPPDLQVDVVDVTLEVVLLLELLVAFCAKKLLLLL